MAHAAVAARPPSPPPCGVHTRSHLRSQTRGPRHEWAFGVCPCECAQAAAPRGLPLVAHGEIFSHTLVSVQVPAARVRDRAAPQSRTSHVCGSRRLIRKFLWVPRAPTAPKRVAIKTGRLGRLRLPDSSTSSKATGTRPCARWLQRERHGDWKGQSRVQKWACTRTARQLH